MWPANRCKWAWFEAIGNSVVASVFKNALWGDMRRVAEGIENRGELEAVRDLGIPLAQGYLIARPSPVERLSLDCDHIAAAEQINT
jgi:EAL domain-containing protein (putative c-di-GMP-specific phosphodiesterase class I)